MVIVAAGGDVRRQAGAMADENRMVRQEGYGAEAVVGMGMGEDHVADRQPGGRLDGGAQADAIGEAATGIDDGDGALANDEADIGDAIEIGGGGLGRGAHADKITLCGLHHRENASGRRAVT